MKLIWHIIRKDLARLGWPIAGWLLLFVMQIGIGFILLLGDGADLEWLVALQIGAFTLVAVQMLTGFVLVTRLVQEDALVGTDAMWSTRPVSGFRLLLAKLMGAGMMFGLLPVVIMLPWWLVCGFGWRELWHTAVITLGWQVLMIVAGMWLASLTDTIGRLLMWTLVVVAWVGAMALMLASQNRIDAPWELAMTRWWLAMAIGVALGTGIIVHQFLTRRVLRSSVLTVAGLGMIGLVLQFWPWSWAELSAKSVHSEPAETSALTHGIKVTLGLSQIEARYTKDASIGIATKFRLEGVPESMAVTGSKVRHRWRWSDGMEVSRQGTLFFGYSPAWASNLREKLALPEPRNDPETERYKEERRQKSNLIKSDPKFRSMQGQVLISESVGKRMLAETPTYTGMLQAALTSEEAVAELQLHDTARKYYQAKTIRVSQVIRGNAHYCPVKEGQKLLISEVKMVF